MFLLTKNNLANNSIFLKEILPGILLYNGVNEEANKINQGAIANKIAIIGGENILVFDAGPSKKFAEKFIKK